MPSNNRNPQKSGSSDTLFWLVVLVLGALAVALVGIILWNGWQSANAEPTEMAFSFEDTPVPAELPTDPQDSAGDNADPAELNLAREEPTAQLTAEAAQTNPTAGAPLSGTPEPGDPVGRAPNFSGQSLSPSALKDDFSFDQLGWSTSATESSARGFDGGAYFIESRAPGVYALSFVPVEFPPVNLNFEAAVTTPGPGTFGVLCQYVDEGSFYLVEINPELGEVSLGMRVAGVYLPLSEPVWQPLPDFDPAAGSINSFRVRCNPDRIAVSTNGGAVLGVDILNPLPGGRRAALFAAGQEGLPADGFRVYWDNFSAQSASP